MDIAGYLDEVRKVHATGVAGELSYRPALASLFNSIDPDLDVINEPRRVAVGAPDFVFQRDKVARGWCEHKDIDKDVLKPKGYSKEQKERYTQGLPNLIYTNGLDFEFIRDGDQTAFITIADFAHGLPANPDQFERLKTHLQEFAAARPLSIRSAKRLAELMAGKAKLIKEVLGNVLKEDADLQSELANQFKSFKANLLPNLTPGEFSDIYAETVTYGMFAARFHDQTPDDFSRQEALELLPKSNPFLRSMFQFVAGYDLDDRIAWIVDDLADLLQACDVHDLFKDYGKWDARNDPFIHFYEDFLGAYNPKKRKSRGVWYTPEPVVDFIVRAVDDVLKQEFGLPEGLADTSKVTVDWDTGETDKKGKPVTIRKDVHRVQILDPATGTGTFLAKATQLISDRVKGVAPGAWSDYVEKDLLPRLHGFELLMASYAMCHMKLDMQLTESGYTPSAKPPRVSVWLTNALEPAERVKSDLFWTPLAKEAEGAADVKRQTPIMCVIGNPPYSGESANKGDHIKGLMEAYKMEPGGKERLKERNPKWINDDYVKFIRMSEDLIARNPSGGVLGFITNHGYLDNPTFRGMRWHLLKTFDKIWVIDLHGNAKKKEVSPDGSPDKNVFDIQQGVALIIAVRKPPVIARTDEGGAKQSSPDASSQGTGSPRRSAPRDDELAEVWHGDLWGSRKAKSEVLGNGSISNSKLEALPLPDPFLPFVPRDLEKQVRYREGVSLNDLSPLSGVGVITKRDKLTVHFDATDAYQAATDILNLPKDEFYRKHSVPNDVRDWRYQWAVEDIENSGPDRNLVEPIYYRLFDKRHIYYTGNARGFVGWPTKRVMRHFTDGANVGFCFNRTIEGGRAFADFFAVDGMIQHHTTSIKEVNYLAPLYLYPDEDAAEKDAFASTERTINFDPKLYAKICKAAGIDPADTDMAREKALDPKMVGAGEGGARSAEGVGVRRSSNVEPPPPAPPQGEGSKAFFRAATGDARPSEVKVFDYIYGVLHSPDYRETFAEFLKIDFPRIPYPASPEVFAHISEKGEALRRLHLMEPAAIGETASRFMGDTEDDEGRNVVASGYPKFEPNSARPEPVEGQASRSGDPSTGSGRTGKVYINSHQYFENVPELAWNFYIGGYQPARKWLKDRKGRRLEFADFKHYQSIVKILTETDRIMKEIKLPLDIDN